MIPEVNPYNNYRGDGSATKFDFDFFIQDGSQLIVEKIDNNDVVVRLKENIDYEIVMIDDAIAGYINFPIEDSEYSVLQEDETLSLQLDLPFAQESEYGQSSLLDLNSIEFSLDYLTRLCQILKRQLERSVKVNEGSDSTPTELLETLNNNALVSTNAAALASKKADEAFESANIAANASEEINNKIAGFNESFDEMVDEITQEGEKQLQNIQSSGFYMRDDKLYFIDSNGEEQEFKSGAGSVMFDTKIADHILQGEEALGWALQGTYVTKDAYPDFYNKCLEEYKDENTTSYIPSESWTQPVPTDDTTSISGGDMVITASSVSSGWKAYLAFDGIGTATAKGWATNGANIAGWWQVKFPYKIRITGLKYYRRYSGSNDNATTGRFYTSSEKTVAIGNEFSVPAKASEQYSLDIANIPSDGIVTDTIYLETQAIAGSHGGMDYLEITAVRDLLETQIYKNPNGHKFYPLKDKPQVDNFYEKYGIADFYGIDEENERVFLPRNKYFAISGVAPVVGNGMTLGVTNGAGTGGYSQSREYSMIYEGMLGESVGSTNRTGEVKESNFVGIGITTDPAKSGIEAQLQPDETKYLYYCVGNTEVTQAITNVTEITESENDTIPLFAGMYFDFKPNNASWLKAGVQQNSAGIYKTCYNTLVEIVNGVNNYDLKVINQEDMISGVNYDEYWILDQDNMTFRTPLAIATKSLSGGVAGNGMTLGLTDGTAYAGLECIKYADAVSNAGELKVDEASYGVSVGQEGQKNNTGSVFNANKTLGITTDPTKSGIIAEQSTAQLYFKVANAVQNLELLDAGKILDSLVDKLDRNNKEEIISWRNPDYSAAVTINVSSAYTVPYDGQIYVLTAWLNGSGSVTINGVAFTIATGASSGGTTTSCAFFNVSKGDVITFTKIREGAMMIPFKGVK